MMNAEQRIEYIRENLNEKLSPVSLEIIDDSHLHAGHASAGGGGHFTVKIVSDAFKDKKLLARHRLVYEALEEGMKQEIHALSIKAYTPEEVN
jgi:BolA protein